MKASKLCHLRDLFLREWSQAYPTVPSPVLNGIADLAEGSVIDESVASGHILAVRESLDTVNDKINQLREQTRRELFVKQFLIRVLGVLDETNNVEDQLAEVTSELDGTVGPKAELSCVGDLNRPCAVNQRSGNLHKECSNVDQSVEVDLDKIRVHSPTPKLEDSDSCTRSKFVSRITVSENKTTPTDCKSPFSHSVSDSVSDDREEESYYDNNFSNNIDRSLADTEHTDMFGRRKRSNISKPSEGELAPHNLGSKDNFLAVKSKHISPGDIPRHNEGATNSPQLPRNFQLLKLTSGFDIVLGETEREEIDNNNIGSASNGNSDTRHASRRVDHGSSDELKVGFKNRIQGQPDDVIHSSGPRENVSTIQVVNPKRHDSKDDLNNVESPSVELNRKSPACDQMAHKQPASNETLSKSSEGETFPHNQGNPFARQTSGKKGGPPPVAKKPSRPGSSKKLPQIPAGPKPVLRPTREITGNPEDSTIHNGSGLQKPVAVTRNSTGDPALSEKNIKSGALNTGRSVDSLLDCEYENINSRVQDKIKRLSPSPLVSDLQLKHTVNTQQLGSDRDLTGKERNSLTEIHSSLESNSTRGHRTSDSESKTTQRPEELYQNMKSYNIAHGRDERKERGSIGALVEGTVSRMVSIDTKLNQDTGLPQADQPLTPDPSSDYSKEHGNLNASGLTKGDYHRMTSSASTDTIVNDKDRSGSFSSDVEVREAVYGLDDIISGERTETVEESSVPEKPEQRKRKNSRPDIENWPINRAITASITQQELDSVSDDDELDDISVSSAAASPCLKRLGSSKGSKDSGLCDDLGIPDSPQNDSVFDPEVTGGRLRDHKVLHQMESCAEEEDQVDSIDSYQDKDAEEISVTSDTVLVRQGDRHKSLEESRESYGGKSDTTSIISSGEEDTNTTMDSSYDETDSAREGMLKMRQLVVKGVLDSEKVYLKILELLIQYKKQLEATSDTSQPVISRDDIAVIFSDIETINEIHREFVTSLEPKVKNWSHSEQIGKIFNIMIFKFSDFGNYLNNYQNAVSTIHKCASESERFQELSEQITVTSTVKEVMTLEDALFKPVLRVQRNTLLLHDLIKYTPEDHPDHGALQDALKESQSLLEKFASNIPQNPTNQENRRLVKSSFLVELVNGSRKLRYMFLFSDVLICTKRETHRGNKVTFDVKWYLQLSQAQIDTKFNYTDDTKVFKKDDIEELKSKIRGLKKELRVEMRKFDDKEKRPSIVNLGGPSRVVEKLRKKINTYEAQLILASPRLPFKVYQEKEKIHTLLMTTDYEREEWKETIASLCKKCTHPKDTPPMSSILIQDLINSVKETPQVNKIGNVLLQKDEELLTGTLNVTIHKLNGLAEACDTYCCLEMDSFGHFFMKARTNICETSRDPAWNEDFELELEGSNTLRILCFKQQRGEDGDKLLGRGALELSKQWLKGSFQEKTVSMNDISLVISLRHTPSDKTMSRIPSRTSAAVFGVKISSLARRESKPVPTIVTACLQEVEKRGLDEVGIYRVSGVTSDLQKTKKLFDKNIRSGAISLADVDIHAVTGILKLYFRELPEPLFTEATYQNFIEALKLSDEEAKAQCMLSLLHSLPDTNYYTIVTLMEHLLKVARNVGVNKMSIHNLATIFGPTLLAPAVKQTNNDPMEMMCKGAEQVMRQSSVVNYLLGLAVSGRDLRRSAQ